LAGESACPTYSAWAGGKSQENVETPEAGFQPALFASRSVSFRPQKRSRQEPSFARANALSADEPMCAQERAPASIPYSYFSATGLIRDAFLPGSNAAAPIGIRGPTPAPRTIALAPAGASVTATPTTIPASVNSRLAFPAALASSWMPGLSSAIA
jgi:hypothetical protein